jgi:hypothetical protein
MKNMAMSWLANAPTRLHPGCSLAVSNQQLSRNRTSTEEWVTGEAAGVAAALFARNFSARTVLGKVGVVQAQLLKMGHPLRWNTTRAQ